MLHLVEQHGGDQHRIDPAAAALAEEHRPQLLEPPQGVGPQRLQLIKPLGEELGQGGLGAMHPETPLQLTQFGGAEIEWIGALPLVDQSIAIAEPVARRRGRGRLHPCRQAAGQAEADSGGQQQGEGQPEAEPAAETRVTCRAAAGPAAWPGALQPRRKQAEQGNGAQTGGALRKGHGSGAQVSGSRLSGAPGWDRSRLPRTSELAVGNEWAHGRGLGSQGAAGGWSEVAEARSAPRRKGGSGSLARQRIWMVSK